MEAKDFVYWLNGYLEVANPSTIGEEETKMIKEHLKLVLTKVTQQKGIVTSPHTYIPPTGVYCSTADTKPSDTFTSGKNISKLIDQISDSPLLITC